MSGKIRRNFQYRMRIYKEFALNAINSNITWIVLHGIEGYPDNIGRDLDILCDGEENTYKAIKLFVEIAQRDKMTRWIVLPNPIWGRRALAISENYEVAELHILNRLNTGLISYKPNFKEVQYNQIFPVDQGAMVFKAVVMPVLGANKNVGEKISKDIMAEMPKSLQEAYYKIIEGKKIKVIDKWKIYFSFCKNPIHMYKNYKYAKSIHKIKYSSPTTPLVVLHTKALNRLHVLEEELNEIFLGFVCGDCLSKNEIRYNQARQRLVYFTKRRDDIERCFTLEDMSQNSIMQLVNAFEDYNKVNMDYLSK